MNVRDVKKILSDTAYVRTGGSSAELACADYIVDRCALLGSQARIEPFGVTVYEQQCARLTVDGREVRCKSYYGFGNGSVKARLYYLADMSDVSLRGCKGKIVLVDKPMGYKLYDKLVEHGAQGFITSCGNVNFPDNDIDTRERRFQTEQGAYLLGGIIHISDAIALVKSGAREVELTVEHTAKNGSSHNVILDIDGELDETVVVSAHYDSTALSVGAYDNMSSCIGLFYLAEQLTRTPLRRRVRLLWCGSEERGLLGSLAYCRQHASELESTVLNINLDMLGSVLGGFVAFSCADEEMRDLLERFMAKHRFGGSVRYDIRSSDSNSFVYHGVPAVSFARYSPAGTSPIHTRYDTAECINEKRLLDDMRFIAKFVEFAANGELPPRVISEKISTAVSEYFERKIIF